MGGQFLTAFAHTLAQVAATEGAEGQFGLVQPRRACAGVKWNRISPS
jgi:hypothetical protein